MGLSGQIPSVILNGVNPSPSRHEPLFQELSVPWPSPKEAKGLWAAAIFPHSLFHTPHGPLPLAPLMS